MKTNYTIKIWNEFDEDFVLECLEKVFRKLDYSVTNYHKTDRVHEDGIDLLCEREGEKIAIQAKIKPRKADIKQFILFEQNTRDKKAIYIHIENPTRPFRDFVNANPSNVEFWDANVLHKFLVENESIEYYCLYFSMHPLISSLIKTHVLIFRKRHTSYTRHRFTVEEIAKLWAAKDNSIKVWVSLYFIYKKWNKILMAKTEKNKEEFESILEAIFNDLNMAHNISADKLVSSIEDLSEKHPNLIRLLWELSSQRTNWITYTSYIDSSDSLKQSLFFTSYYWVCPLFNESKKSNMSGFYSSMNYLLENFQEIAKNIEDAIDWVFSEMNTADTDT